MKIEMTCRLTAGQKKEIEELQELCLTEDRLQNRAFLSNELNFDPEFPCFYLGYQEGKLAAFLTVFRPQKEEGEVLAYTHPAYRQKGCFTALLQAALEKLRESGASFALFLLEPNGTAAALKKYPLSWDRAEYRMAYSLAGKFASQGLTAKPASGQQEEFCIKMLNSIFPGDGDNTIFVQNALRAFDRELTLVYEAEKAVGIFCLHFKGEAFLYALGVLPEEQGRGLGKKLLACACRAAAGRSQVLVLDVDSSNPPALALYRGFGFETSFQVDYYRTNLETH